MKILKDIFHNNSHPLWVFIQQFAVRGFIGVKFLLIARLLTPSQIGIISIALISLTFSESVTEIGLMQAVVQNKRKIEDYDVIWTVQFIRGLFITLFLLVINKPLIYIFREPNAEYILYLVAFVPLVKNMISSRYYNEMRNKNFKNISIIFGIATLADLVISMILVYFYRNPIFAIYSLLISEAIKTILTHFVFGWTLKFDFKFKKASEIMAYGRWIWGNSISSFCLNQFDKILTSVFLGVSTLGLYQMSQKLTQMLIADISFAAGQYLFPNFSQLFRKENHAFLKVYYSNMLFLMICFSALLSTFVVINTNDLIKIIFGYKWIKMNKVIDFMMIGSSLTAISNVSVVYNRAIGRPKLVTIVSYIQLILFMILCVLSVHNFGLYGLIFSSIISYLFLLYMLNYEFKNKFKFLIKTFNQEYKLLLLIALLLILMIELKFAIHNKIVSLIISGLLFLVGLLFIAVKFKENGETY